MFIVTVTNATTTMLRSILTTLRRGLDTNIMVNNYSMDINMMINNYSISMECYL